MSCFRDVGGSRQSRLPEEAIWVGLPDGSNVLLFGFRAAAMTWWVSVTVGANQYCRIGGKRDGEILAYHLHVVQEAGAHPAGGSLPANARAMLTGCYDIPSVGFSAVSVVTNTTPRERIGGVTTGGSSSY